MEDIKKAVFNEKNSTKIDNVDNVDKCISKASKKKG